MATGEGTLADFAAVLLDMDGVVLDSMGRHAACWQKVMAAEGLEVSLEFILQNEGCLGHEVLLALTGRRGEGLSAMMARMLEAQRRMFLDEHAAWVRPYPQAVDLIAWLRDEGVPTALVTSSRQEVARDSLGPELLGQFSCAVTADDVRRHKPHPEPYLKAADKLGLSPRRCLVIENAPAGIAAARAAGATCYAVTTTLAAGHLAKADRVFAGLEQVRRHLRG